MPPAAFAALAAAPLAGVGPALAAALTELDPPSLRRLLFEARAHGLIEAPPPDDPE